MKLGLVLKNDKKMNYYIAIADIHGDIEKLNTALSDCENWIEHQKNTNRITEKDEIQFIFLGDYVDRGSYGKEVLKKVKEYVLEKNAIMLLGNHDMFLIGTVEGTSVYFEEHKRSRSNSSLWWNNGGYKTCKEMFGIVLGENFEELTEPDAYKKVISESEEYKFLKAYGRLKYETELIFFSHAQQSNPKDVTDDTLLWGRSSDYSKLDVSFKVPGNKAMSVHGHFHRINEKIFFPRMHHYVHSGKAKTVVMADCGCGCDFNGRLHPVVIVENTAKDGNFYDFVQVIAIL